MITLRNLYTSFAHDPQWQRLATKCLQPMISIYLRKLGNRDIATITDFDLQMHVAMSEQPIDVKAPAQSCMNHLRNWAKEQGCSEFASDCELTNAESLKFHLSVGFEEANRIICFTKKL